MTKQEYIQSLKKEVEQFHPFLNRLFLTMQKKGVVTFCDYTHGPNEVGADFILISHDSITEEEVAIAVIVKVGSISNSLEDVERQVAQSKTNRRKQNGDEFSVRKFWVVTNNTISNNAKAQINEKFKNNDIDFWDYQKVIKMCDKYMGDDWLEPHHSTNTFLQTKRQYFVDVMSRNSLAQNLGEFPLRQTVVERKAEYNSNQQKNDPPKKVNVLECAKKRKMILLEGGFGSGKTRMLHQIGLDLCDQKNDEHPLIPIYLTYQDLCTKYRLDADEVVLKEIEKSVQDELQDDGQYLFLIDGVDEANFPDREKAEKLFKFYQKIESKNVNAVLATRNITPLFQKEERLKSDCRVLEIRPLSTTEIIRYILNVCKRENLSNRVFSDLSSNDLFKDIAKIPITAILLAQILKNDVKDLPSTLPELFLKFVELSLGRWDVEKGLLAQKQYEALDAIATDIAIYMFDNSLTQIGEDEAKGFFAKYVNERNTGLSVETLYRHLVDNSGIVTVYDACFSFKHRAILEFLYARRKALEKTLPINKQMLTLNWQNVYYFYYGCLKDCPDEIKAFKNLECSNTFEKMMKLFFAPNFLLAAYNTPYNVISETLSSAFNESGHIYLEMKKDADCPFLRFSEMNFLWFFQMLMRNLYSYNFFRDAIEKYLVDLDSNKITDPDAYTLFFISMIRVTLKIDEPTDFLFDMQNKLPAQIKLGLFHEVKSEKDLSEKATTYIKKMTNKLKRNGFADKGFLKTLYNEPLTIKAKKKV